MMGYDELKDKIYWHWRHVQGQDGLQALVEYRRTILAVVELHRPAWASDGDMCLTCSKILNVTSFEMTVQQAKYPCSTIQAIEKELA